MVKLLLIVGTLFNFTPRQSITIVATIMDKPQIAKKLRRICFRESRCRAVGVHKGDAQLAYKDGWAGQVKMKHIDPKCQPYRKDQWATRGAFGLSAVSHWAYMPKCYQPEWFDVPLVSAWVAANKYMKRCYPKKTQGWCG